MKSLIKLILAPFAISSACAQLVVHDPVMLAQKLIEMAQAGNPAAIQQLAGFAQLSQSLATAVPNLGLTDLQNAASGANAFTYTANGLYRPVLDRVLTPTGATVPRSEVDYRKFDAVALASSNFNEVQMEVDSRARALREQVRDTIRHVLRATSQAEVQKLQAVLATQGAELASLEREREAALARVLVQDIENRTDQSRQQQARVEDRAAAFQSAQQRLGTFLSPSSAPMKIPAPRPKRQ